MLYICLTFGREITMATGKFISYLRVSTDKQGKSGLGLEAQRLAVTDYLNGGCWQLLQEYVEIETGKRADRPVLIQALHHCKVTGSTLVIAKLDRLSRDLEFIARMQKSSIKFVCADMPEANELTIHLFAAIAQHERQMISKRTKEALAAAKARGQRLGNPHGAAAIRRAGKGNTAAIAAVREQADEHGVGTGTRDRFDPCAERLSQIAREGAGIRQALLPFEFVEERVERQRPAR